MEEMGVREGEIRFFLSRVGCALGRGLAINSRKMWQDSRPKIDF